MKNNVVQKNEVKRKNNRFLITFVCIFLTLVLILGATLATVSAVKRAKSVAVYKGQSMSVEVASFFSSYYKYTFISALTRGGVVGTEDSPGFWNRDAENGKTYGELLSEGANEYIKQIIVANYLYDRYGRLSREDKDRISNAVSEILEYKAEGSKNKFNELVSPYGFDYSSFVDAVTMLYKASESQKIIYGSDGANVSNFPEQASEYLAEYSHVKLLFIRTEDKFVYENGNRVIGGDGNYLLIPLTDEEKAARKKLISEISAAISATQSGAGVTMNAEMFDFYLKNHDEGDEDMHEDGYYFSKNSSFTAEFSEVFKNIVEKSYEMSLESYAEIPLEFGVCFIYKTAPTPAAYATGLSTACFSDFYSDASDFLFAKSVTELSAEVELRDKMSEIDFVTLPYNYAFLPNF